jgi:hypothetical protein
LFFPERRSRRFDLLSFVPEQSGLLDQFGAMAVAFLEPLLPKCGQFLSRPIQIRVPGLAWGGSTIGLGLLVSPNASLEIVFGLE